MGSARPVLRIYKISKNRQIHLELSILLEASVRKYKWIDKMT